MEPRRHIAPRRTDYLVRREDQRAFQCAKVRCGDRELQDAVWLGRDGDDVGRAGEEPAHGLVDVEGRTGGGGADEGCAGGAYDEGLAVDAGQRKQCK